MVGAEHRSRDEKVIGRKSKTAPCLKHHGQPGKAILRRGRAGSVFCGYITTLGQGNHPSVKHVSRSALRYPKRSSHGANGDDPDHGFRSERKLVPASVQQCADRSHPALPREQSDQFMLRIFAAYAKKSTTFPMT